VKVFTVLIYYDMGVRLSWGLVFSSSDLGNIRMAYERLIWGFWDREAGSKQRRNWRSFIRAYNWIRRFDYVLIQIAKTGEIHAMAVVKDMYHDDQAPIWKAEPEQRRVLFPWRVLFCFIIYSEKLILRRFIEIQNYIDGYGLGEIMDRDIADIVKVFEEK